MSKYRFMYNNLIGSISAEDYDLLAKAEYSPVEEIDTSKATDPRVCKILDRIKSSKHHDEEAALGYI